jgi:hypothetical protein
LLLQKKRKYFIFSFFIQERMKTKAQIKNDELDLHIDNYSLEEIFALFHIPLYSLDERTMREAKTKVLKSHPDKSKLDPKYFLFYSSAYKKLYALYEFQNKTAKKSNTETIYQLREDDANENANLLDSFFEKKGLKDSRSFHTWFNETFEKHKQEEEEEQAGYGEWLQSDQGIREMTNSNTAEDWEKHKREIRTATVYHGYNEMSSNTFGGTLIASNKNNYTSEYLFSPDELCYTDIKQAYEESVIPVTEEDFHSRPKYKNLNEYKTVRDQMNVTPLNKVEAEQQLFKQQKREEEESIARAFELAKQSERVKKENQAFWGELKQLKR